MGISQKDGPGSNWSPILVGLGVGAVLFVSTLLAGSMLYKKGKNAIHQELQGNLVRTAMAGAGLIDGDLHKTCVSAEQESSPEYEQAIAPLRRFQDANPDIAYIYTMILEDGELKFVLDPTEEGDADEDGVDDKSHIGEVYDVTKEEAWEMYIALNEQQAFVDEEVGLMTGAFSSLATHRSSTRVESSSASLGSTSRLTIT